MRLYYVTIYVYNKQLINMMLFLKRVQQICYLRLITEKKERIKCFAGGSKMF